MSEEGYYRNEHDAEGLVKRFEEMLEHDKSYYFDLDEFESIIEFYIELGLFPKASKVVQYASELFPNSTVLMLREAQILVSSGHIERALPRLKNLLAFEPNNEEIHLSLASIYMQSHNHHKAIHHLQQALKTADDDLKDDIYIDLALEYENLNNFNQAIKVLKEALMINPENETAIHELAFCFEMNGQIAQCISYYKRFIDRHPYSYISWYNLGNAYMKMEMPKEAINAFDYCLVIDEDFGPGYFNRALAYIQTEEFKKAIEDLHETLRLETPQASTYCYIGECYEKMEEYDDALSYYKRAIEKDEEYSEAYVGIGVVMDMLGKTVQSLNYFKQALDLDKNNTDYMFLYAEVLRKTEHIDQALEVLESLLVLEPDNEEAWLEYSALLADNEGIEKAKEQIELSLIHCPHSVALRFRKVAYLHSLGKKKEAYNMLQELLPDHGNQSAELTDYYPEIRKDPKYLDLCQLYGK